MWAVSILMAVDSGSFGSVLLSSLDDPLTSSVLFDLSSILDYQQKHKHSPFHLTFLGSYFWLPQRKFSKAIKLLSLFLKHYFQ
jgi:hypothetical protein